MAVLNKILRFFFVIIFLTTITTTSRGGVMASTPVKGGYYPDWASSDFPPSSIDNTLFTHIYYAFLVPSNITYKFEIPDSTATLLSDFTTTLRQKNPSLKTLISIGGGGSGGKPELFAEIASDTGLSTIFINSSIELARKYGFDGLDLDWESPENPKEMEDLGRLFQNWREAIQKEAEATNQPALLLTAAVHFSADFSNDGDYRSYPAESISQNLDWINVMNYDYHGSWDTSATGAHTALYDKNSNTSTSYGLQSWINAGVPPEKITMGLALYGRTWTLKDPSSHKIGSEAVGVGPGDEGTLIYSEVVEFNDKYNAMVVYDTDSVSTYSFVNVSWIGYDDSKSIRVKVEFAKGLGLRGYFFWALSYDKDWEISTSASQAWG